MKRLPERLAVSFRVRSAFHGSSLIAAFLMAFPCLAAAQEAPAGFPGIGPDPLRLRFHTGRIVDNKPEISPVLPAIPGPPSPWVVTQFGQSDLLSADQMSTGNPATRDPRLGDAKYAFTAADGHSHVWIYQEQNPKRAVYDLFERDGPLRDSGGANIFLSSDAPAGAGDLSRGIEISLDEKISRASISAPAAAQQSGAVAASVFIGMVVHFPEPDTGRPSTIFVQIPLAGTRFSATDYRTCKIGDGRRIVNLFQGLRTTGPYYQPFVANNGPLRHIQIDINSYIKESLRTPVSCRGTGTSNQEWSFPASAERFEGWKIASLYVGLETQNRDIRTNSRNTQPQGSVEVGLQIADLRILNKAR